MLGLLISRLGISIAMTSINVSSSPIGCIVNDVFCIGLIVFSYRFDRVFLSTHQLTV